MQNLLTIVIISIIFGVTQKLADATNEHNIILFKYANYYFGILFGLSGAYLAIMNDTFSVYFLVLVIYWLIKDKLDFPNHRFSGSIIMFSLMFFSAIKIYVIESVVIFMVFLLFDYLTGIYRRRNTNLAFKLLDKFKIRYLIISLMVGCWFNEYKITLSVSVTILTILITTKYLKAHFLYKSWFRLGIDRNMVRKYLKAMQPVPLGGEGKPSDLESDKELAAIIYNNDISPVPGRPRKTSVYSFLKNHKVR